MLSGRPFVTRSRLGRRRANPEAPPVRYLNNFARTAQSLASRNFRSMIKGGQVRDRRLSGKSYYDLIKAYAGKLDMDAKAFGGHSTRPGFLTSAARRGASIFKMADQSRHKSMDVLRSYVRDSELFQDHAGAGLL